MDEPPEIMVARGHIRRRAMQQVAHGLHRTRLPVASRGATSDERAAIRRTATIGDLLAWQQPTELPVWIAQDKSHNHTRRRSAPRLLQALQMADARAESAWETLLRILHSSCGVAVEPQREFWHLGRFVARGDLWLVGTHTLHEYDGAEHRKQPRHEQDLRRDRRILAAGLVRERLAVPPARPTRVVGSGN